MDTKNKTYDHNIKDCDTYQPVDLEKVEGRLELFDPDTLSFYYYKKDDGSRIQLLKDKLISRGSYGSVYLLKDTEGENVNIALKEFRKNVDPEFDVLKKLEEHGVTCNIMKARLLEISEKDNKVEPKLVTVNELFNGTLGDLYYIENDAFNNSIPETDRPYLQIKNKVDMFKQLVEDLHCLASKGFYYTDLKSANVLYKCLDNGKFRVAFGDLGSLCHEEIKAHPAFTYYPPEGVDNINLCSEASVVWGLGILLLELIFLGKYKDGNKLLDESFYWMSPKFPLDKYDNFMKELDKLSKGDIMGESLQFKFNEPNQTTVLDLAKMMLTVEHKKRITVEHKKRITLEGILDLFKPSRFSVKVLQEPPKPAPLGKSRFAVTEVAEEPPKPTPSRFAVQVLKEPPKPAPLGKSRFAVSEVPEEPPKPAPLGKSRFAVTEVAEEPPKPTPLGKSRFAVTEVAEEPPKPIKTTTKKEKKTRKRSSRNSRNRLKTKKSNRIRTAIV